MGRAASPGNAARCSPLARHASRRRRRKSTTDPGARKTLNTPLRGIFFDLDDTLIGYADAERSALEAGCAFAAELHPVIDPATLANAIYDAYQTGFAYGTPGFADLATLSVPQLRRRLTDAALESFGIHDPAFCEQLVTAYADAEARALAPFADAHATLERLRPHFRLGVITNGPSAMQRGKLAAMALDGFFDTIVIDTEFGHPKPDPRIFEHAARAVDLSPSELLFVGNSFAHDVAGAVAAGWTSVWLRPENPAPDESVDAAFSPPPDARKIEPHHTIARLGDLLDLPRIALEMKP